MKIALAMLLVMLPGIAAAQSICGERAKFLAKLAHDYKEAPTATGITADGRMLEVLTSEAGTWTMIITNTNGLTCMVTAGQAWEVTSLAPKGEKM